MRRHSFFLLTVAALSLGFAPAPLPSSRADLKKMQGTWVLTDRWVGTLRMGSLVEGRLVVRGNRMTYADGRADPVVLAVTLDAAKSPKTIDQNGVGGIERGKVFRGIYRLDGDTLRICVGWQDGSVRPGDFDGTKPGRWLEVWKRRKP